MNDNGKSHGVNLALLNQPNGWSLMNQFLQNLAPFFPFKKCNVGRLHSTMKLYPQVIISIPFQKVVFSCKILLMMGPVTAIPSQPEYFWDDMFSCLVSQLMVNWWFGFLGPPSMKGIVTWRGTPIESQTTGPQTINLPLVESGYRLIPLQVQKEVKGIHDELAVVKAQVPE